MRGADNLGATASGNSARPSMGAYSRAAYARGAYSSEAARRAGSTRTHQSLGAYSVTHKVRGLTILVLLCERDRHAINWGDTCWGI